MFDNVQKVSIIGGSGTGKTTLANSLGKEMNLPVYHMDGMNYYENWVERDKKERDNMILQIIKKEKWIIDGTYRSTLEERLQKSDLIIYLDYSTFAQLKGVMQRFFKSKGKERQEIPGCKERLNWNFLIFVIKWRKKKREFVLNIVNKIDKEKVVVFKNRRMLNKWYKKNWGRKII